MTILEKTQLVMALAALFGLVHLFKVKNKWAKGITIAYVISVGLSFVSSTIIKVDAYYLFILLSAATVLYAFSTSDFSQTKKLFISLIAILSTLPNVLLLYGSTSTNTNILSIASLMGIIPVGIYVYILIKKKELYNDEHGFLTILSANAAISFFLTLYATALDL